MIQLGGRPVAIFDERGGAVETWDVSTRQRIGEPFTTSKQGGLALSVTQLDGRPVVVSGDGGGTVRVWSLGPAEPLSCSVLLTGTTSNRAGR